MNKKDAERNMISQQIKAWGVLDREILDLFLSLERENFVPEKYREVAYADLGIPLADGQVMTKPKEAGRILAALDILPTETVLEIGTGSGYLTALLAEQANHLHSVELNADIAEQAKKNLAPLKLGNVSLEVGDAAQGWSQHEPYDVIVITSSLPVLPACLKEQLNIDGRIYAILGNSPSMHATLLTKYAENEWETQRLFETIAPRLNNINETETFTF